MTFDNILREIGSFGPFQRRVIGLISLLPIAQSAILLAQVFIAGKSDHWCRVDHWQDEDCHQWDLTEEECILFKRNISAPMSEGSRSQCTKYNLTGLDLESAFNMRHELKESDIVSCDEGWEFDRSVYSNTINEEWDLVCEKDGVTDILQSVSFAGYLVGSVVAGIMADRFGRYYTIMACCTTAGVSSVLAALSPNVYIYAILRFLSPAASYGATLMTFVIASELVLPTYREWTGNYLWFYFSFGYLFLAGVAKFTYSWRLTLGIISLPYLLMITTFPFICESPRWLIANGKFIRAEQLITKMARTNKKEVPTNLVSMMENEKEKSTSGDLSLLDLIRNPTLRCYMSNMIYIWFVQGFVFFGLSLGTDELGVSVYLAFSLSGAIEEPAHVFSSLSMKMFGRRPSTSFWMLLAGASCFATIIAPLGAWRVTVALIGKMAISASFTNVYVYAGELLPTPLRAFGVGMCSVGARVGGIVAPLLLYLGDFFESLPLILFGASSILGGLLTLLFPETNKKTLPDTIEDAENLRKKMDPSATQSKIEDTEDKFELEKTGESENIEDNDQLDQKHLSEDTEDKDGLEQTDVSEDIEDKDQLEQTDVSEDIGDKDELEQTDVSENTEDKDELEQRDVGKDTEDKDQTDKV